MSKCNHDHSKNPHDKPHAHSHTAITTAFKISIFLNLIFVAIEIFYGYLSNSMALVADAFHNFSDVLSLVIALVGFFFAKRANGKKISAGTSIFNAVLLFFTLIFIVFESVKRLIYPAAQGELNTNIVMLVAFIGIIINFGSAILFKTHQHDDLNAQGAYLHLMADAAISLGVVISAFAIKHTGFNQLDSIISILISIIIFYNTLPLLRKSIKEYKACT
ncbi:MAG: cation transporter [Bdellovibrionaceae bacterium]|nr:cation transporter [Pseudobdellovibrionaceae bacterium]